MMPPPPRDDPAESTSPLPPAAPAGPDGSGPANGVPDGPGRPAADDLPIAPADVASAGRSCSAILILLAAILIVLCVGTALRWIILS